MIDEDFAKLFNRGFSLVTLNVVYYLPDHEHLVNEFVWQTLDQRPRYPRVGRFLDFWRCNIGAVIKDIYLSDADRFDPNHFRKVDELLRLH